MCANPERLMPWRDLEIPPYSVLDCRAGSPDPASQSQPTRFSPLAETSHPAQRAGEAGEVKRNAVPVPGSEEIGEDAGSVQTKLTGAAHGGAG